MPSGFNTDTETEAAMVRAYVNGATCAEAARPFGLSAGACKLALRRNIVGTLALRLYGSAPVALDRKLALAHKWMSIRFTSLETP